MPIGCRKSPLVVLLSPIVVKMRGTLPKSRPRSKIQRTRSADRLARSGVVSRRCSIAGTSPRVICVGTRISVGVIVSDGTMIGAATIEVGGISLTA